MNNEINELKSSLIYRMSLGSKELYHSNVLAYLIENKHECVKIFYPEYDNNDNIEVFREKKHTDLLILIKNKNISIIIENKMKSIPDISQLRKYNDSFEGEKKGFLLGLKKPYFVSSDNKIKLDNGDEWTFIDYMTITKKIRNIIKESGYTPFKKDIIEEYLNNNESIEEIVDRNIRDDILLDDDSLIDKKNDLDELGIYDMINKLSGSKFIEYLKSKKLEEEFLNLNIEQSFNNKKVTINLFFKDFKIKNDNYSDVGVQIEGKQYKYMVSRKCEGFDELFDEDILCQKIFDKSYQGGKKIKFFDSEYNTRMNNRYCKYDLKKWDLKCVYQYYNVETNKFNELYDKIHEDLKKINNIINSEV